VSCVVVGAGPGLGAEIVKVFARDGFDVGYIARRPERLAATLDGDDDPPAASGRVRGFRADVADPGQLTEALDAITDWGGPPSVLIYNAARMVADDVETLSAEELAVAMRINAGAALQAVQHVLPAMRRVGRGTVLLTGGGLGLEPYPDWASLGAGKAALRSLGIGLHKALAPAGIHVAVVAIAGIIDPAGPLTPARAAALYRDVHREDPESWRREVVFLPPDGDPFYNDPEGRYRTTSSPVPADPSSEPG
jgi:NAD(P)-dependent dehydrogenase (short-subunit alcohol dehydrogenase family)